MPTSDVKPKARETRDSTTRNTSLETDIQGIGHDLAKYLYDYARAHPEYAALWCLGIGFVLGWKLKPW
jgi:hypothetical protein